MLQETYLPLLYTSSHIYRVFVRLYFLTTGNLEKKIGYFLFVEG